VPELVGTDPRRQSAVVDQRGHRLAEAIDILAESVAADGVMVDGKVHPGLRLATTLVTGGSEKDSGRSSGA
jgi:hypothetical protein